MNENVTELKGRPSRFRVCLAETLKWEGSWSNDPYDSGGATMRGVIQRVYDAWRTRHGLTRRSVRDIEESELQAIYKENYWSEVKGESLPPGLDLAVFDFGVNSGPYRSIIKLQGVLGVAQDGQLGPLTLAAIDEADVEKTIQGLQNARQRFVRQIRVYWRFGKGWERRIAGVRVAALKMAGQAETIPDIPVPKPDAEAQSVSQGRATEDKTPISARTAVTVAAPVAASVGSAVATIPKPPQETVEVISAWQSFTELVRDVATTGITHWPYFLAALAAYVVIVHGLPAAYRRLAT